MIAWCASKVPGREVIAVALLAACAALSCRQARQWHDTETLFAQCVRATRNNAEAHYNLALAQYLHGKKADAARNFAEAIRIRPHYQDARNNLGLVLLELGDSRGATNVFTGLLRLNPTHEIARLNMGQSAGAVGRFGAGKRL